MQAWSVSADQFAVLLGCSQRAWSRARRERPDLLLPQRESDRLVVIRRVFDHAGSVFDDQRDAVAWLSTANDALSGATPLSLMGTDAGAQSVDDVLTRLEFGVYA
ncbi:MAG: DUF2384 domain-containing protein [Acidobacteria bacterium]|nr:DUF2384 domain-containing protein [Acidobacteriota bacterium]